MSKKYYSDRVARITLAGNEVLAYEVTLETKVPGDRGADFDTWAWCPDQASAAQIAAALEVVSRIKKWWYEGDGRSPMDLLSDMMLLTALTSTLPD